MLKVYVVYDEDKIVSVHKSRQRANERKSKIDEYRHSIIFSGAKISAVTIDDDVLYAIAKELENIKCDESVG